MGADDDEVEVEHEAFVLCKAHSLLKIREIAICHTLRALFVLCRVALPSSVPLFRFVHTHKELRVR